MSLRAVQGAERREAEVYPLMWRAAETAQNNRAFCRADIDHFNWKALELAGQLARCDHWAGLSVFPFSAKVAESIAELFDNEVANHERLAAITRLGVSLFTLKSGAYTFENVAKMSGPEFNALYNKKLGFDQIVGRDPESDALQAAMADRMFQLNLSYLRVSMNASRDFPVQGRVISGMTDDELETVQILGPDELHRAAKLALSGYTLRLSEKVLAGALSAPASEVKTLGPRLIAAISSHQRY